MLSVSTTSPLSLRDAHLINFILTLGYVLPLYLTKYTRLSFSKTLKNDGSRSKGASERWRDDPAIIKARLLSVLVSTIASLCLMHRILAAGQSKVLDMSKPSSPCSCYCYSCYSHAFRSMGGVQRPSTSGSLFAGVISPLTL